MTRSLASPSPIALLLLAALAGCENDKPREDPAYLFESRVALDPLLEALKKAGDDPRTVLRPASPTDLGKLLEPGKRYDYGVMPNNAVVIAPKSVETAGNFWSHPILANGGAVKSAGQDVAEGLKDSAQQAVQEVKSSTQESAQRVKDEGRSSADEVRAQSR